MAQRSRFRFSIRRLMIELGLLALPLGLMGGSFQKQAFEPTVFIIVILMAAWFVFTMEVTYACFLLPEIIEPWKKRSGKSTRIGQIEEDRPHPLD